jgi:hypothetical protein
MKLEFPVVVNTIASLKDQIQYAVHTLRTIEVVNTRERNDRGSCQTKALN